MENSLTAASQQQPTQLQKKKKSKNKKGQKAAPAELVTAAETDKTKKKEVNENGLGEQLAHELYINKSTNNNSKSNNTACSNKGRTGNKLANGTADKEMSGAHQLNGHDCSATTAASAEVPAQPKSNGSPVAVTQQTKKTKSKNNKLKNKENEKSNCHEPQTLDKQANTLQTKVEPEQDSEKQTCNNGFCSTEDKDQQLVTDVISSKLNTNDADKMDTQVAYTVNKPVAQEKDEQKQHASEISTPASTAKTAADDSAAKQDETTDEASAVAPALDLSNVQIEYKEYESELQMHDIMRLIQAELSEPYSIYTYRYFIYNWPKLCFLAAHGNEYVGAIVCKLDRHMNVKRGYIAMLAVRKEYRKLKIGTTLVQKAIEAMLADNADEVVLETEMRNVPALRLYENLGFVRDKRLFRYYLNGVDALRLKLWFR